MWPWGKNVLQLRAILAIIITLAGSALDYLKPIQFAIFVDAVVLRHEGAIWSSFWKLAFIEMLDSPMCLETIRRVLWIDVSLYRSGKFKLSVQTHILKLDAYFHSQVPSTDLIKAVDYAGAVDKLFDDLFFSLAPNLVCFVLAFSGLLHRFGTFMMLILACTAIFHIILEKRCIAVLTPERDKYITVNDKQERRRHDGVRGWQTVLNHGQVNYEIGCFDSEVKDSLHQARRYNMRSCIFEFLKSCDLSIGHWAATIFILYEIRARRLSIGDLIAFSGLWELLLKSVSYFSSIPSDKLETVLNATRLRRILESKPSLRHGVRKLEYTTSDIEFRNVQFSYPGTDNKVLDDFSLKIKGGETVAFVGPSGIGKSTLLELLKHLIDPTGGSILIDGVNISSLETSSLNKNVGMMPQNPYFFNETVMKNMTYGKQDATVAEIYEAAASVGMHESTMKLKAGYETMMTANGENFSGGQRQRLALCRVFIQDPAIVLIDEGTSALDAPTEASIKKSLEIKFDGRTTIIVAHRLSSIKQADRIYFLGKGCKVVEEGTHTELVNRNGHYARQWKLHIANDGNEPLIDLN